MMTIKQFASLCGCNAQTLRYYDRIDLLKPARVDRWTGYRYYEDRQAIEFIKIKNLQLADFSIEEIRPLLLQDDQAMAEAFDRKIEAQREKLDRIIEIQRAYLREKSTMEKLIQGLAGFVMAQISDYEGLKEFGLNPEDGDAIVAKARAYMERILARSVHGEQEVSLMVNDEIVRGADRVLEKIQSFETDGIGINDLDTIVLGGKNVSQDDYYNPEEFEPVWEKHGWQHVREFIDDVPGLEEGHQYCFQFRMEPERIDKDSIAFPMFMIGAMVLKNDDVEVVMGCDVEKSRDGMNHFRLMRKKEGR